MTAPIIVIGAPRTGTSMVAGILHHLGVHMGDKLQQADEWNAKGYFVDTEIDAQMRDSSGRHSLVSSHEPEASEKLIEILRSRSAKHTNWGFKASDTITVLPQLLKLFPTSKIIKTERPFAASVDSYSETFGSGTQEAIAVIGSYLYLVERGLKDIPHLKVNYLEALSASDVTVREITAYVGLKVTDAALEMIDAKLRRH